MPQQSRRLLTRAATRSSKVRNTSPAVSDQELSQLTASNADFAWAFYEQIAKPGENLIVSPHSLSVALAMMWAGARGSTEAEMADVMEFTLGQEKQHPAFNALDLELATRVDTGRGEQPRPFALKITNRLFVEEEIQLLDPFLDTLAEHYDAGVWLVDFVNEAEPSRRAINQWVSEQTNQRIEELLAPGAVTRDTRLVLANAIYFTARWIEPFEVADTKTASFTRLDGTEVQVERMWHCFMTALYGPLYTEDESLQAVRLPYTAKGMSMLILVPREGKFEAVESELSGSRVRQILGMLDYYDLCLRLPKFSFRAWCSMHSISLS